ncbi:hypothetical protein [Porphyromonas gingivalis]|uniref:hypothetical protein n=1 Tax=Porphyromonas gingivalis TaxID=837 RepID=UPI001E4F78F0|nr:hypothetical protein [Porphyromonas gingivalis]
MYLIICVLCIFATYFVGLLDCWTRKITSHPHQKKIFLSLLIVYDDCENFSETAPRGIHDWKIWDESLQAVRLPDLDDLYITVYNLTSKRPINVPVDSGNLSIALPCRKDGKDPAYWNYLGVRAQRCIESKIEVRFWAEAHEYIDEQKHRYRIDYIVAIESFMLRYGITSISDEAIRKNYYRWLNKVRRERRKELIKKLGLSVSISPVA